MALNEIFLIAGGPESRRRGGDPLLGRILTMLSLKKPAVAYIGAASNDNHVFYIWLKTLLKKAGAGSVHLVPLAAVHADLAKARSRLQEAGIIFISGGDVEFGMKVLERTGTAALLKELFGAGKPFIGLSAGSIMLARSWVRWPGGGDDAQAEAFPCLGMAPLLCDTHAEKENWEELKALLRILGPETGLGIPAGAALRVRADGFLESLGKPVPRFHFQNGRLRRLEDLKPI